MRVYWYHEDEDDDTTILTKSIVRQLQFEGNIINTFAGGHSTSPEACYLPAVNCKTLESTQKFSTIFLLQWGKAIHFMATACNSNTQATLQKRWGKNCRPVSPPSQPLPRHGSGGILDGNVVVQKSILKWPTQFSVKNITKTSRFLPKKTHEFSAFTRKHFRYEKRRHFVFFFRWPKWFEVWAHHNDPLEPR